MAAPMNTGARHPPSGDLIDTPAAGPQAARGGAMRAGGYVLGTLLALISSPLMIRHLGVEDYGRYVTVLSLVTIIAGFTEAGVNTIALREYAARSGGDRWGVMRDLLGIRVVVTLVGIVGGLAFALVAGYDSVLVFGTVAAGFALLLQSLQSLLGVSLQGELRFGWVTITELLRQALFVALVVALVLAGAGLGPFFLAQIPAFAVTLAMTAWLVRRIMPLLPSFHPARWWPLLRATIAYAIAVALNATYFRIAILVLSLQATERETGYFATAFRVVEILIAVPALIFGAAFPILARAAQDDRERLDYAGGRLVEVGLVIGVWLALGVFLGAEPIIRVLAGDQSDASIALLRIQSLALIATFVIVPCGYLLLSLHRHRAILVANVVALATSLGLSAVLVPAYEATGAAIALLAAEVALAAMSLGMVVRQRPAVGRVLPRAPAILAAGVVAGLVALVPGIPAVVATGVALLAYPLLLLAVRRFPPEVADALRGLRSAAS
jgi:O-antigen/teichoic acid export membrane protein